MTTNPIRVCVVGAGPCGMSAIYRFVQLETVPEIVCYEKQSTWGGLWNYSWQTGTDEYGEPCHSGMYKNLWSNGPKECIELPDYTFEEHYGKPITSFPPREVLRDYLEGRWTNKARCDLKQFVKFNHAVQHVSYNEINDNFSVIVRDLKTNTSFEEHFTHVIAASGIFGTPNKPDFEGLNTFNGRVLHSHDFRDATEFKDKRVLLIGSSYSAEDLSMQCVKFGAKQAICSYRTKPMGFKWPPNIEERPLVTRFEKDTAFFKDGTTAQIDAVILCTGYLYNYPYMAENLRLKSNLTMYVNDLYKGVLWTKGGNNKMFYLGTSDQYFTFTMFDVQALWVTRYIAGTLPSEPVSRQAMLENLAQWRKRESTLKGWEDDIPFQADYISDLGKDTGYEYDAAKCAAQFLQWEHDKHEDILTYRDKIFTSIFTNNPAAKHTPWFKAMDTSIKAILK